MFDFCYSVTKIAIKFELNMVLCKKKYALQLNFNIFAFLFIKYCSI